MRIPQECGATSSQSQRMSVQAMVAVGRSRSCGASGTASAHIRNTSRFMAMGRTRGTRLWNIMLARTLGRRQAGARVVPGQQRVCSLSRWAMFGNAVGLGRDGGICYDSWRLAGAAQSLSLVRGLSMQGRALTRLPMACCLVGSVELLCMFWGVWV